MFLELTTVPVSTLPTILPRRAHIQVVIFERYELNRLVFQIKAYLADPSAFAVAAAPVQAEAAAEETKEEVKEESDEESDDDMGFSLFD